MPYNLDSAIPSEVKYINSYKIVTFTTDLERDNIIVNYNELSGDEVIGENQITIKGDDFAGIVNSLPNGAVTFKGNLKEKLYEAMEAQLGIVGTVI